MCLYNNQFEAALVWAFLYKRLFFTFETMLNSSFRFLLCIVALAFCFLKSYSQITPFEMDKQRNRTTTYQEMNQYYEELNKVFPDQSRWTTFGDTDIGKPLRALILSKDGIFEPDQAREEGQVVFLINNGIHPGEPEGIDASMMLTRDLLRNKTLPGKVVLVFVAAYNIDGMLNRGISRVNQNGPESYGFRGNRQNLDLNRDFIKTDSRNAYALQQLFHHWNPDVFLDNHSSNGADYQYIMTLIDTQRDKMHPSIAKFMKARFTDPLYERMEKDGFRLVPYVDFPGETPESGLHSFLETPRYSTGYAALFNTIAYMPETHMWKPYKERVASTYRLMEHLIELCEEERKDLLSARRQAELEIAEKEWFPLNWRLDTTRFEWIDFHGYEAQHKASEVSGEQRLFYDRSKPFTRKVKLYDRYKITDSVQKPLAYIVPQAYRKVIDLLSVNGVHLDTLKRDTLVSAEMYYVKGLKTRNQPFEGHYLHSDVELETRRQTMPYYAGDVLIRVNQPVNRYIVETLEPQGGDSFFAWGFFDAILGQKEYFSAYIFEDYAAELLSKNSSLREAFDQAKKKDPKLQQDARLQLDWLYKHSAYYEQSHRRYPVARIVEN